VTGAPSLSLVQDAWVNSERGASLYEDCQIQVFTVKPARFARNVAVVLHSDSNSKKVKQPMNRRTGPLRTAGEFGKINRAGVWAAASGWSSYVGKTTREPPHNHPAGGSKLCAPLVLPTRPPTKSFPFFLQQNRRGNTYTRGGSTPEPATAEGFPPPQTD